MEVVQSLGRVPYETLVYGMDPAAAHAHAVLAEAATLASPGLAPTSPGLAVASIFKTNSDRTVGSGGGGGGTTVAKLPYAREIHDDCELPNAVGRCRRRCSFTPGLHTRPRACSQGLSGPFST